MENRDRWSGDEKKEENVKTENFFAARATFKSRRIKERMLRRSREGPDGVRWDFPTFSAEVVCYGEAVNG